MSDQLVFDLPHRAAMGREDFFVSPGNAAVVAGIEGWADWPLAKMILVGAEGAGKTHLAHVWAAMSGAEILAARDSAARAEDLSEAAALVVEDADGVAGDAAAEEALFHIHNALGARGAPLLLTARDAPERWGVVLPDLASRMAQAGVLRLPPPDDALLTAVMMKLAHDRKLPLTPVILSYAAPRIERSFAAAARFVADLDAHALARKRPPTRDMAKAVLSSTDGA